MNYGISVKICLARVEKRVDWLAGELGMSRQMLYQYIRGQSSPNTNTLDATAKAFDMATSAFVREGEAK